MDLPDPKRLFAYYSELHDAGFGDKTARAIVAAVAGAAVHEELTATLEVTAERIHPYTAEGNLAFFREQVERGVIRTAAAIRNAEEAERDRARSEANRAVMAEEFEKGLADARREVACLFDTRYGGIGVRCEPSLGGGVAYLSMDEGVGQIADHLTRSETVLLRDTLTAILEAE